MSRIELFARIAWTLIRLAWCRLQTVCFEAKLALLRLAGFDIPEMPEWLKRDQWHELSDAELADLERPF